VSSSAPAWPSQIDELLEAAHEQLRWIRAASIPQVRATLETVLDSTEKRKVYEMCDGETSSKEIADALDVPKTTISTWTREWRNLGLASEAKGRSIKHLASPSALSLKLEVTRAS
jgi:DNA-directed RNA polymerase specialized sigma24 family protein